MNKEMKKTTNRKMLLIKNLMELTYSHRRQSILLQPTAIDDLNKEYPALGLVSEVSICKSYISLDQCHGIHCIRLMDKQGLSGKFEKYFLTPLFISKNVPNYFFILQIWGPHKLGPLGKLQGPVDKE